MKQLVKKIRDSDSKNRSLPYLICADFGNRLRYAYESEIVDAFEFQ